MRNFYISILVFFLTAFAVTNAQKSPVVEKPPVVDLTPVVDLIPVAEKTLVD
jgi:hypothetical protein